MNRTKQKRPKPKPIAVHEPDAQPDVTEPAAPDMPSVEDEYAHEKVFPCTRYHDTNGIIPIENAPRKARKFYSKDELVDAGPGWKRSPWPEYDK